MGKGNRVGALAPGDLIVLFDGENEGPNLDSQLTKLGLNVIVVRQWNQLQIDYVRSIGSYNAYVEGLPLHQASVVIYLSPPTLPRGQFDLDDEGYVRTERERVIIAVLLASGLPIVNHGWVDRYAWNLRSPEHQINVLAKLGWPTPDVVWSYNSSATKANKRLSVNQANAAYLTLSRHTWFITQVGEKPMNVLPDKELLKLTSAQLIRWHLDWVSIPLVEHNGQVYAMGMRAFVPLEMPSFQVLEILRSSLLA